MIILIISIIIIIISIISIIIISIIIISNNTVGCWIEAVASVIRHTPHVNFNH